MPTIDCASNVAAAFGGALAGVVRREQVVPDGDPLALGAVKMFVTVNFASRSCAPSNARPGEPTGVSHGGRQIRIWYAPSAVAAPLVGST